MSESIWLTTTTILRDLRDPDNEQIWRRFVGRFRAPIEAFVRRLGVASADVEDVVQNALTAFAQGLRAGRYARERGRLNKWLFGIAYHQALMQKRQHARHRGREQELDDEAMAVAVWGELWDRFLLERSVEQARSEFSGTIFEAFRLVVLEELSPAEAARRLELDVKQVYNAKHRVLSRVRVLMQELDEIEP